MKQVLSVADFTTILELVNNRLCELRFRCLSNVYYEDNEELRKKLEENALADLEADGIVIYLKENQRTRHKITLDKRIKNM